MSTEEINDLSSLPVLHFLPKTSPTKSDDDEQTEQSSVIENTQENNTTNERITTASHSRRVHFPTDDSQLRHYSSASNPFSNRQLFSLGAILQRYRATCQRLQIRPLNCLLDQLSSMDDGRKSFIDRIDCLKIINEKLDLKQIEAIEEILSRCRFHTLDFDSSTIDESAFIQLFDILEYYESCTHISFSNNRSINYQGYQALTKYLRRTNSLERLDMNSMRFDESNIVTFTRSLRLSTTLYELHVESCQLNGRVLQKFIENLRSCISLRELYLCDNRLQVQDSLLINNLIRTCGPFLHSLDLRLNSLQDGGMSHLASQLSQYDEHHINENNLCKLSLESNQLTSQGIGFLAKALLHNRTIRSLNLSNNNLTNEGLFLLRDALLTNRTIQELILRNCRLTDQAAIALAEYIAESTTIQYVDLRGNTIQASGICGMAIAIKMNKTLLRLDFDPIDATPTNFNSLFSTTNIDRANNFLSLVNFRRITASSINSTSTPSGGGTRELLEQKGRWMNDIEAVCQRNILIYEENLRQQQNLSATETNSEQIAEETDISTKETSDSNPIDSTETTDSQDNVEQLINSSIDDENPIDSNPSDDNTDEPKPRLEHSDSIFLLRQKVHKKATDSDNTSDDESQLSTIEEHLVDDA